jgi:hypothetical protein
MIDVLTFCLAFYSKLGSYIDQAQNPNDPRFTGEKVPMFLSVTLGVQVCRNGLRLLLLAVISLLVRCGCSIRDLIGAHMTHRAH